MMCSFHMRARACRRFSPRIRRPKRLQSEVDALQTRLGLSSLADVVSTLDRWMGEDRKETELKSLQGLLWRDGYASGDFTGHVYPDVK